jgi:hypothetical protein
MERGESPDGMDGLWFTDHVRGDQYFGCLMKGLQSNDESMDDLTSKQYLQAARHARAGADWYSRLEAYYTAMWHKYEEAAAYPWRTIEPDPPDPR